MSKKTIFIVISLFVIIGSLSYVFIAGRKTSELRNNAQTGGPTAPPLPTRTQEEIKVISEIKDYNVDITAAGFTPSEVTVKTNDQVFFTNKDSVVHKVKGENWGNVPIGNGERFVQSFKTPGVYEYTDAANPALKGKIIVK